MNILHVVVNQFAKSDFLSDTRSCRLKIPKKCEAAKFSLLFTNCLHAAIRKNLGEFECVEGKYCEHQLPPIGRLFKSVEENNYMVNDVSHEPLKVYFLTVDGMMLSDQSWIKYDQQR